MKRKGWGEIPVEIGRPSSPEFGDLSTNVAFKVVSTPSRAAKSIAEQIVQDLILDPDLVEKVEVAGPGFINFYLDRRVFWDCLREIIEQGKDYGRLDVGQGRKTQVEFVSANPTGSLNVVSARAATVGDVLVNLLDAVGYRAEREYYVNDAGRQVRLLGESVNARYLERLGYPGLVPEDGYFGEYVKDLARELVESGGDSYMKQDPEERIEGFSKWAAGKMVEIQRAQLAQFGVHYDVWFNESTLYRDGAIEKVVKTLGDKGLTYQKDGALWFRSSVFGDDEDRVIRTREGQPTYLLPDIAYHKNKRERGFEKVYDLWGPDHHGYVPRMKAAMRALGYGDDFLKVIIIQQVNLIRDGKPISMSKRSGDIISMGDLITEVGTDAARFFFLMRRTSSPLDFDLNLAVKQSEENPVYYVQYAHARIASVFREYQKQSGRQLPDKMIRQAGLKDFFKTAVLDLLTEEEELNLIKCLMEFPDVVLDCATSLEPHRLTGHLMGMATAFHRFYHKGNRDSKYKVITHDEDLTLARLALCRATQIVLRNSFGLLGISAPERM